MLCLLACIGMAAVKGVVVDESDMNSAIRQNYQLNTNTQLNLMLKRLQDVEKIFQAYESFLHRGDIVLPCFGKWAGRMANEVWRLKEVLINEMKNRGGAPKYHAVDLKQACENILKDSLARLGDVSDNTRMCICEKLLQPTATLDISRLTGACPSSSSRWPYGKLVVEDALSILRYLQLHSIALAGVAKTAPDFQIEHVMQHQIIGKLRAIIKHTSDHVTAMRKFQAKNYVFGEYQYDRNEMCSTDINFENQFLGGSLDRAYS